MHSNRGHWAGNYKMLTCPIVMSEISLARAGNSSVLDFVEIRNLCIFPTVLEDISVAVWDQQKTWTVFFPLFFHFFQYSFSCKLLAPPYCLYPPGFPRTQDSPPIVESVMKKYEILQQLPPLCR